MPGFLLQPFLCGAGQKFVPDGLMPLSFGGLLLRRQFDLGRWAGAKVCTHWWSNECGSCSRDTGAAFCLSHHA